MILVKEPLSQKELEAFTKSFFDEPNEKLMEKSRLLGTVSFQIKDLLKNSNTAIRSN